MARGRGSRGSTTRGSSGQPELSARDSSPEESIPQHSPIQTPIIEQTLQSGYGSVPETQRHDARIFIEIHPDSPFEFRRPEQIVRMITRTVKGMYSEPWSTWSEIPVDHRRRMFQRFSSIYRWDPRDDTTIQNIFEHTVARRFSESMNKARTNAAKRASQAGVQDASNPENVEQLAPYHPDWINSQMWEHLCRVKWNTDAFKRKRISASNNRRTDVDGGISKHTGGSISTTVHRDRMEVELGRSPHLLEVFTRTHSKKRSVSGSSSGSDPVDWVDSRSQRLHDAYLEKSSQRSTESGGSSQPVGGDLDLWLEVTGGQKKGRTLGAGRAGDPRYVLTGESSSSRTHTASPSVEVENLRTQLEQYQSRLTEEEAMRLALQQSVDDMSHRVETAERSAREREARAEEERAELRRMMEQMMQSRRNRSSDGSE